MLRKHAPIISNRAQMPASSSQIGDFHDVSGHRRYYGSSACNGGERMIETRRGSGPQSVNPPGF